MQINAKARLLAGLSPILFHVTGVRAAASIMKNDRFELKPAEGTAMETQLTGGGAYYLSTARSPNSAYITGRASESYALFELDGTKLATRYTGKAVDYWGPDYYKGPNGDERPTRFEAEDRLLSPKKFLPASPYLRAVYVLVPDHTKSNIGAQQALYDLKKFCLLRKIKIYFFTTSKDLLHRNLANAVKYVPEKPGADPDKYVYPREILERQALNPERKNDNLGAWYALYKIPKKDGVASYDQLKALSNERILSKYKLLGYSDAISSFEADLHNAKSTAYGGDRQEREHLDLLVAVMRKNKQTPKQFIDALNTKWYPRNI